MNECDTSEATSFDIRISPGDQRYVFISCSSQGYDVLWNRLKRDPMLADQLSAIQLKHPSIEILAISDTSKQRWSFRVVVTTALLTILVYSLLAGIICTIFVGLNTMLKWITG
jgi:hypothetical protein